jgi:hypothetical protein
MGTTTNNGWPTPVATDLVKDGWEAIKDLGDAIDTTLGVYAPSTSGLTLINTTSFSAVASQSFSNVFSSTYKNYRIVFTGAASTGFNQLRFRMRASGTDNTSSNYFFAYSYVNTNNAGGILLVSAGTTSAYVSEFYDRNSIVTIDINSPFATDYTNFFADSTSLASNTVASGSHFGGGGMTVTTSYDGFTIFPNANNMTGEVSVYGYNK